MSCSSKFSTQKGIFKRGPADSESVSSTLSHIHAKSQYVCVKLVAVSSKIQQCQLELQQAKEASHTLQGEQVVKRLKLAGLEVDAKLLAIRRRIAQEQKDKVAGNKKQVIGELVCPLY